MQRRQIAIMVVSVCLLALTYIYLIMPCQKQLKVLHHDEDVLLSQIKIARLRIVQQGMTAEQSASLESSNTNLLTDLSMLAQMNGLQVDSIVQLIEKNKIRLNMLGNYINISRLMDALSRQRHILYVNDFTIKTLRHGELQLQMEIVIVNASAKLSMMSILSRAAHQVFCNADKVFFSAANIQFDYPVQQIKMVGYMNISHSPSAFIELPDGSEYQASIGSLWGKEKALVVEITNHYLKLKDAQGKIYILHIQESE